MGQIFINNESVQLQGKMAQLYQALVELFREDYSSFRHPVEIFLFEQMKDLLLNPTEEGEDLYLDIKTVYAPFHWFFHSILQHSVDLSLVEKKRIFELLQEAENEYQELTGEEDTEKFLLKSLFFKSGKVSIISQPINFQSEKSYPLYRSHN
jgi:hypothetical protein